MLAILQSSFKDMVGSPIPQPFWFESCRVYSETIKPRGWADVSAYRCIIATAMRCDGMLQVVMVHVFCPRALEGLNMF